VLDELEESEESEESGESGGTSTYIAPSDCGRRCPQWRLRHRHLQKM